MDGLAANTFLLGDENTPTMRTPFGDPMKYQPNNTGVQRWMNFFNPMQYHAASDDVLYTEINDAGILMSMPPEVQGNVNWTQVPMPNYQYSAYDWVMERIGTINAGGATLRGALMEIVSPKGRYNNEWQALKEAGRDATGWSPAEDLIKGIWSQYYSAAWQEMLALNPQAAQLQNQLVQSKAEVLQRASDGLSSKPKPVTTQSLAQQIAEQAGRN